MLKNLLLDLGNVTLRFDPVVMTAPWVENEADRDEIIRAVFTHPDWGKGDDGSLTEDQILKNAKGRLPRRLHPALEKVIEHWPEYLKPLPGAEEFLRAMKARGFKLFILSNAPARYEQFKTNKPILNLFDGEVISALVGYSKPGVEFFRCALDTFHLKAEECFFVDDIPVNAAGAEAAGIQSYVFDGDYRALTSRIDQFTPAERVDTLKRR
jgi:putative hydrolase of the HAD superfamily